MSCNKLEKGGLLCKSPYKIIIIKGDGMGNPPIQFSTLIHPNPILCLHGIRATPNLIIFILINIIIQL